MIGESDTMNIFSSGWLQHMVDKAAITPTARIQTLFQILQDWSDAPGLRAQLQEATHDEDGQRAIMAYLLQLVEATGVAMPEVVARQLHMVLLGALVQEMRQPGTHALEHAKSAAIQLVTAQMPSRRSRHFANTAIVASVALMVSISAIFLTRQAPVPVAVAPMRLMTTSAAISSPDKIAEIYHLHAQMQAANCSYPQALMLAPDQRGPFLENVVNGDLSKMRPEAIVMVSQLYQKVDCYYPPSAMLL